MNFRSCYFGYRPRQYGALANPQAPKQPQMGHQQQQKQSNYSRVYAFMAEAARQALTPDGQNKQ